MADETRSVAEDTVSTPKAFPEQRYTPFGYVDNPYHSAILNRSGAIRSVPPLGFGYWCRRFPWPYGEGTWRRVNYLSFLLLAVRLDGILLASQDDFQEHGIELISKYHTKTMFSYDWQVGAITFSAKYYLAAENALVCILDMTNSSERDQSVTVYATNHYGFPELGWWGCDGIATNYHPAVDAMVSKIYAGGEVFVLGANQDSIAHWATKIEEEWNRWLRVHKLNTLDHLDMQFPGSIYACMTYDMKVLPLSAQRITFSLSRGVNEAETLRTHQKALQTALSELNQQLKSDQAFYERAPLLSGDWPETWKQGWIYDLETLRMTIRPPVGIYQHPWDGMQIFAPRQVLGETMLDTMCLSYADPAFAKEVIFGTFADAPAPNVPCSREDGSMNMIGASGSECGTAPIWGLPFYVIRCIYLRDRDDAWIRELYPYLKRFIEWWLENRTDEYGWFHCDNSWESGQDGSKRFTYAGGNEASPAAFVRTVDIEASMADAMNAMALFAGVAGHPEDRARWQSLAEDRIQRTRDMYLDGWFRDYDARTDQPIILEHYLDVMMLVPVSVGIATPEQVEGVNSKFHYFRQNPKHWLEWPSFMFPFTEAAWRSGLGEFTAEILAEIGNRIYARTAGKSLKPMGTRSTGLPDQYNYRIPGVQGEFWPVELNEDLQNGCECYGWGATFPTLAIRNLIGFREGDDLSKDAFVLAPAIPGNLLGGDAVVGKQFGIRNLHFRNFDLEITCSPIKNGRLGVRLDCRSSRPVVIEVMNEQGERVASSRRHCNPSVQFSGMNAQTFKVSILTE